jgi:cytochrome c-type biogenesis protein CcmE
MFHMKQKHRRLLLITCGLVGLSLAAFLTLSAFQETLMYYYTPIDLSKKAVSREERIRLGGLVEVNSVVQEGESIRFRVTDGQGKVTVFYKGLLPDLFREGQGVVLEGYLLKPTEFQAETVLAKHDEKYMPKQVADQLKQAGLWQDDR